MVSRFLLITLCATLVLSRSTALIIPSPKVVQHSIILFSSPSESSSPPPPLSPESPRAKSILRDGNTEPAFSSDLNDENRSGTYVCAGCLTPLFFAECKFDSGTGWPSFWAHSKDAVATEGGGLFSNPLAAVFGRECTCKSCGGHLGHRFEDGPQRKTGKRFCINGAALRFREDGPTPKGTPLDS